ncbi:MAG: 2-C-methyl-D-erythritol 4-phosphate cytidylyltransferase, partial [Candidatus Latescibacteria bacterium]|nr:2-C-methyl-D-erythritol 4-phosphate cytidylyltransferase [Candidatus Latescibacterota bacterium]
TLMEAYNKAANEGFRSTDDSALVECAGGKVNVVEGSYRNIKITTPEDMLVAELFLK